MKFTDGYWSTRPGVSLYHCAQVQDARFEGDRFVVYCSHFAVHNRGMTLNHPLITLSFFAPRPGILALSVEHFRGILQKQPAFALHLDPQPLKVQEAGDLLTISAGSMSATITKNRFSLNFYEDGRRLSGLLDRHLGYATTPEGPQIRVKLDIGVGEKIYGLGERFTPFVKNGQSIDIWNEDGGTASELAYKNIPFYVTNRGYGVFVDSPGRVSYELCSEAVQSAQFSLPGEKLTFMIIGGGDMAGVLERFSALTGRPALPPAWSFGLWLTTSFTTQYDQATILSFVDGMRERDIPLHVFHFDCFWMPAYEWCGFAWDPKNFKDPGALVQQLKARGLKTCVWINPYIGQKSALFDEAVAGGYLLKRTNGDIWQWDMWQAGMGIVDFTNPGAWAWYQGKLKALLDLGIDSFKTDFGERIPTDCVYFDGSDPVLMHNYYAGLYNQCVFELLERELGQGQACLFARSATVGGQQYPVHWGGDSSSTFPSMAESLRAGLSLCLSGFAFWSHDISGFEDTASPQVYQRWAQFGLLSSHSRLHGSSSYRVPWLFGEDSPGILAKYTRLKCRLMPYLYSLAVGATTSGLPLMRAMVLAFPGDRACEDLDLQYMLGDSLLVAPVFQADGRVEYYLPEGSWTDFETGQAVRGGRYVTRQCPADKLPLLARENSILLLGQDDSAVDYDYLKGLQMRIYQPSQAGCAIPVVDSSGQQRLILRACTQGQQTLVSVEGQHQGLEIWLYRGDGLVRASMAAEAHSILL